MSPVRYELEFYISEDGIVHSHRRENLKSYIALTGWALKRRHNMSPERYKLGFYFPEDGILHSHRREDLKFELNVDLFCYVYFATDYITYTSFCGLMFVLIFVFKFPSY
jgi:hypothetical protein